MTDEKDNQNKPLMTFPCEFSIKVFGDGSAEFRSEVIQIVSNECDSFKDNDITENKSKNGKYVALTIPIQAESQEQLDNIYKALSASPHVLMAL